MKKTNNWIRLGLEWFLDLIGSGILLIALSKLVPKTMYIDLSYYGVWAFLSAFIISVLNRTIKPIIVWLTLPLTGLTFGLFYPFIHVIILNLVDLLLGSHFIIHGIGMSLFVAIVLSILTLFMNHIINKLVGGEK